MGFGESESLDRFTVLLADVEATMIRQSASSILQYCSAAENERCSIEECMKFVASAAPIGRRADDVL